MSTKIVNRLHHLIAETYGGVEYVLAPREVREVDGDEAKAWKQSPVAVSATEADEAAWDLAKATAAAGGDPTLAKQPSGTISSIETPTHEDAVRGLVRDGHHVAEQPTLPATGGGELRAVPDEKAAYDRGTDSGAGNLSDEELGALEGAHAEDVWAGFSDDELKGYADENGIDLGRTSSRAGFLAKIKAHEAKVAADAADDADGQGDGQGQ